MKRRTLEDRVKRLERLVYYKLEATQKSLPFKDYLNIELEPEPINKRAAEKIVYDWFMHSDIHKEVGFEDYPSFIVNIVYRSDFDAATKNKIIQTCKEESDIRKYTHTLTDYDIWDVISRAANKIAWLQDW